VRILLVENNARVHEVVGAALRSAGHVVQVETGCAGATAAMGGNRFDLAIVDVGLPDGSGLDLCRALRKDGHDLPMLVLTARTDVRDRVAGLDAGADDYMGKPFAIAELHARVRALLRRGPHWIDHIREFGDLVIDRDRRLVTVRETPAALTPRECDIVTLLAWRDGRVVSRDEILESVWGEATAEHGASLEVLVARIRRKLGNDAIRTVRNVGYAWSLVRSARA
jgi:two-component system OmpR family response regulator